jgi:hypothetical protein
MKPRFHVRALLAPAGVWLASAAGAPPAGAPVTRITLLRAHPYLPPPE